MPWIPVLCALLSTTPPVSAPRVVPLPGGEKGIGFDDLLFAPVPRRVLAPAGRTGAVDLVDPKDLAVTALPGFSADAKFSGGHDQGTTSADFGHGLVFATDRSAMQLVMMELSTKQVLARLNLESGPDYVRWVAARSEVWVTEPRKKAIEVFTLTEGDPPKLERTGAIAFPDGPESLVIDAPRGRAYTHAWGSQTFAVDLVRHAVVATWKNGCEGSRGIALDAARGQLFVGCDEGRVAVLDVTHDGRQLAQAPAGKGVDVIAYDPARHHLYVPGGDAATLSFFSVAANGALTLLGTAPTAEDAHCVTADDLGNVYVCDPTKGRLLVFTDGYGAAK
jgi:DNA-binding beta-propeller fold protein YncE